MGGDMNTVTMLHPPSGRVQRASQGAYEQVWSQEGWVLVAEPEKRPARKAPAKKSATKPDES